MAKRKWRNCRPKVERNGQIKLWPRFRARSKSENEFNETQFHVEALELRQMLVVVVAWPSVPSPVDPNPCEPVFYSRGPNDQGGSSLSGGPSSSGSASLSAAGPRLFDGRVAVASNYFESTGFGQTLAAWTVWSPHNVVASGENGNNMANMLAPVLRKTTDISNPRYAVIQGSAYRWFETQGGSIVPMFYGRDTLTVNASQNEYVYTDSTGNTLIFYDFNQTNRAGEIKSYLSATGITTTYYYISGGGDDGKIDYLERSGSFNGITKSERFDFSYYASGRLSTIAWQQYEGSSWVTKRQVQFTYYTSTDNTYGNAGDLKTATVKDGSNQTIDVYYYRYHKTGSSAGKLKFFFGPKSYDRMIGDGISDPFTASDTTVDDYADVYMEFDTSHRLTTLIIQGDGCSSCSGGLGTYTYSYSSRSDNDPNTKSFNRWRFKTTETLPDNSTNLVYANEFGEAMLNVFDDAVDGTGGNLWRTYTRYDDAGRITIQADPVAIIGHSESKDDLVDYDNSNSSYIADAAGLISTHSYVTTGDLIGYYTSTSFYNGELDSTGDLQYSVTYESRTGLGITVGYLSSETVYRGTGGSTSITTNYDYVYHTGLVAVKEVTIENPTISTSQNGSNSANTESLVYNEFGYLIWTRDAANVVTYVEYDLANAGITQVIADVNSYSGLPQAPSWSLNSGAKHIVSTFEVDFMGRATKSTDPNGIVDYIVYRDPQHEVRKYIGWNSSTSTPTIPTVLGRFDRAGGYFESITMTATPNTSGGKPIGTESVASIQNWTRTQTNKAGQISQVDAYFYISGLTYSTSTSMGTEGTHFLRTEFAYNGRGVLHRIEDPTGTIRRTVFDGLNRPVSDWIGTDDTPTSGTWSPTNTAGTNLQNTHVYTFDGGSVGNSNLTQMVAQTDSQTYTTKFSFDFRNRLLVVRRPDAVATGYTYSNLSEVTQVDLFADADNDLTLDSGELRGRSVASFDDLGRIYASSTYEVDPSSGAAGDRLTTNFWYDSRGFLVKSKSPNGLLSKSFFDRLGRQSDSLLSIDSTESSYADALTASGDTVIEQSSLIYDLGSRLVAALSYKRLENDITSTGLLNAGNSYRNAGVLWYDMANRVTHSTTFGRDDGSTRYVFNTSNQLIDSDSDGIPDEAEGSPRAVNTSNDWITSEVQYDAAGRPYRSIDNLGRIAQTNFDILNRPVAVIQNFVDGVTTSTELDTDQQTTYDWDSAGRLSLIHNLNATGSTVQDQVTRMLYESLVDASWTTNVIYPDSSDTTSSGTDQIKYYYDALGRLTQAVDQRGVDHRYNYDSKGRLFKDRVVNSISGVDVSIRRIELSFDDLSRVTKVTSYDAGTDGNVVNDVEFTYNGYGLISQSKQEHDGAVDGSTPSVNYTYADGAASGEAKYVRLTGITYPGSEDVHYLYPSSGIGDALNRVDSIADDSSGTTKFAQYAYLGVATIVSYAHPAVSGGLVMSYGSAGTYSNWDRFGRILEQKWTNDAGTTTRERTQYTYDRNSNRLTRTNPQETSLSEGFTFDGLDRLVDVDRNSSNHKSWGLDATGNWNSFTDTSGTQTRTHNAANEVLTVSGQTSPVHDAAGNITQAAIPTNPGSNQVYVFDGWNRLVQVKTTGGSVIASYEYDGRGFRIEKTIAAESTTWDYFHNEASQVVEVRENDTTNQVYVWDLSYVDTPVMTKRDSDGNGSLDQNLYFVFDALRNITALIFASNGNVAERYHYESHGAVTIMTGTWTSRSSSLYDNTYLFNGRELDGESGLYYFRARYLDPALGRFINRDPMGYVDGMNLYEAYFVPTALDPNGTNIFTAIDTWYQDDDSVADDKKKDNRSKVNRALDLFYEPWEAIFNESKHVLKEKLGKFSVVVELGELSAAIGASVAQEMKGLAGKKLLKGLTLSADDLRKIEEQLNGDERTLFEENVAKYKYQLVKGQYLDNILAEMGYYEGGRGYGEGLSSGHIPQMNALAAVPDAIAAGVKKALMSFLLDKIVDRVKDSIESKTGDRLTDEVCNELKNYILEEIQKKLDDIIEN